jgi:hypothetical protein
MSAQPPSSGSGADRIDGEPEPNLPGFDLANRFISEWARGMSNHVHVYNRNWGRLRAGTLTFSDLVSSIGELWQSSYDTTLSMMLAPLRQDNVQWVNFVVDWTAAGLSIPSAQRVEVPRASAEGPPPMMVGMHVLGDPLQSVTSIEANRVLLVQASRGQLRVAINPAGLEDELRGVKHEPETIADFLGLVFEAPSSSSRPALIVTLRIVCR